MHRRTFQTIQYSQTAGILSSGTFGGTTAFIAFRHAFESCLYTNFQSPMALDEIFGRLYSKARKAVIKTKK